VRLVLMPPVRYPQLTVLPHLIPGDDMALHDSPLTPYLTAVLSGDTVVIRPKEQPEKGKPAKEK
jgi:hypothetical protein